MFIYIPGFGTCLADKSGSKYIQHINAVYQKKIMGSYKIAQILKIYLFPFEYVLNNSIKKKKKKERREEGKKGEGRKEGMKGRREKERESQRDREKDKK